MEIRTFASQTPRLYRKHSKLINSVLAFLGIYLLLSLVGLVYRPLSPGEILKKEHADAVKAFFLGLGVAAPLLFIVLQVAQVVVIPIPGQVIGFVAGYVFGWKLGAIYTMIGLTCGSLIVFSLSRKFGRPFVERLKGAEAVKDFETLFGDPQVTAGGLYQRSKESLRAHGLLTFFLVMLLPGLPDNLACFAAGLTNIPIRRLILAAAVGRLPATLTLVLLGDGWSSAAGNTTLYLISAAALLLTALYLWKRRKVERLVRHFGFRSGLQGQREKE